MTPHIKFCISVLTVLTITVITSAQAQTSYVGNNGTGFGSAIGGGSLLISNNSAGNLAFTLTRGAGTFDNTLVIYFDSVAGGFSNTLSFNDQGDALRQAISGASGGTTGLDANQRSTFTFASGFTADYALAMNNSFAGLWQLATGGNNSLLYQTSANLSPTGNNNPTYNFNINVSNIGMVANSGASFNFVATYLNDSNSFRSNEGFGFAAPANNPGAGGIGNYPNTTASGSFSFTTVPEPSAASLILLGASALVALRRRRNA